nr:hypothetical protein [Tanacetum cinerariifolium]
AANEVPSPPPPPDVPPTHTSSSSPEPSTAAQDTPVRDPTCVREPTPSPSNEAPPTTAATAAGGAKDSAALTDLSLKLDRCIKRVTTLENEFGVTKKVLSGAILKLVSRVKRLEGLLQQRKRRLVLSDSEGEEATTKEQDIDLDALHKLASTSLGGDTIIEAAYTIYKASQDAHASLDAGHDANEVPDDTTMPFRHTIPAGDGIPADAQTTPASSTPISADSSMDPVGQAAVDVPSSTILAADKGKAPMVDDSLPVDLLTEQEPILKNLYDYQLGEDLAKKLQAEHEAEFARQQEELAQKAQAKIVPASVHAAPSIAADVSVPAAPSIAAAVSVSAVSAYVDTKHTVDESTLLSSRSRRKQIAKKRVTPIVDVADDALIKFDSASESDDDPLPYASYAGWEMVPTPLGSIHAYYDMEEHTKHFTSICELLHMMEKNDLRKLLGTVANLYQREEPDTFAL